MSKGKKRSGARPGRPQPLRGTKGKRKGARLRSEERFSRNAETDIVCRLLLEKKKLTEKDALDVFYHGEEIKPGMKVRKYNGYELSIYCAKSKTRGKPYIQ